MTLLEQLRQRLAERMQARAAAQAALDEVVAGAEARGEDLNSDETALFNERRQALTTIDNDIEATQARVNDLEEVERRREAADRAPAPVVRVGAEPLTYRQGGDHDFLLDAWRSSGMAGYIAPDAAERVARHRGEMDVVHRELRQAHPERRDVGTGAFGALVVPQYLTDLWAPLARAGRPIANTCRALPLPDEGMVLNIPRITTGTATAIQASENAAVQETDIDETTLAVDVRTIAGQQDVSRQSLDRGRMIAEVVFMDLAAAYAVNVDTQVINGSGSSGQMLGILNTSSIEAVTYTDATPTAAEFWPKLADAIQRINSLRFLPASVIFLHPRRWGWLISSLDSSNRPLIGLEAPQNPMGVGQAAAYGQVVGQAMGVPVVTDANIPTNLGAGTNEDIVIVARADDLLLFERGGDPQELRFEQTLGGNLTVKLVLYGYAAFSAGRYPKAIATVGGTGLISPSF